MKILEWDQELICTMMKLTATCPLECLTGKTFKVSFKVPQVSGVKSWDNIKDCESGSFRNMGS